MIHWFIKNIDQVQDEREMILTQSSNSKNFNSQLTIPRATVNRTEEQAFNARARLRRNNLQQENRR